MTAHAARRRTLVALVLAALLAVGILLSSMLGQLPIEPSEVVGSLLRAVGIPNPLAPSDTVIESTLWVVRFPRIAMALPVSGMAGAQNGRSSVFIPPNTSERP